MNDGPYVIETRGLCASFGNHQVVRNVSLGITPNTVTAIIGPSGCGKSTFLRCLNRLHEEIPGATVQGEALFRNKNIFDPSVDPVSIRREIGMVFQKPNPFPAMSIYDNVVAGLKLAGIHRRSYLDGVVEDTLKAAALWEEVRDKFNAPGTSLSGGQQQRLCIARALAVRPRVLLMDEPTSALDPISTAKIEELMTELKKKVTVLIVTHNMQQAARISDKTGFFLNGDLVEYAATETLFTNPKMPETERYITGRFG